MAEWVREEGEPNGWTRFGQDVPSKSNSQTVSATESQDNNSETTKKSTKKSLTI